MRGHIVKRGKRYSIVVDLPRDPVTGKRRQKRFSGFLKQAEAERELVRILNEMENGVFSDPGKLTVGEYLRRWLETHKADLKPSTQRHYESIVMLHLVPGLGHIQLSKLQPLQIQEFLNQELRGGRKDNKATVGRELSAASVQYEYRVLKTALDQAVRWGMLPRNPAVGIRAPRPKREELQVLDERQVSTLLEALEGTYLYLPTFLAVHTGMRLGEILGLTWQDIDFKRGVIRVRQTSIQRKAGTPEFGQPKTKNSRRSIDITAKVIDPLKRQKAQQAQWRLKSGNGWSGYDLVCCQENGEPLNPPTVSSRFRELARKEGLEIHFHQLRHTHASMLIKAGADIMTVSRRLGHSSAAFTLDVYGHLLAGMQKRAAEALETLFLQNGS